MIRNTVINLVNFFYPLGNTPAASLTQDLPPEVNADILLLGCGDARNILFTCFNDPDRKLDVTCCDIEADIHARNVLLFTLLTDDKDFVKGDQIWNIYFHWKIDRESMQLLESQAEKLLSLSKSLQYWRQSAYGNIIRFCNSQSLAKLRSCWRKFSSKGLTEAEEKQRIKEFQQNLDKAKAYRNERLGSDGSPILGTRSAAPAGIYALRDFGEVASLWWEQGNAMPQRQSDPKDQSLNPAFWSSTNSNLVLHYGSDPLSGFPLATAYVPIKKASDLHVNRTGGSSSEYAVACGKKQFMAWTKSFHKALKRSLVIRICVADALSFSLTLQGATLDPERNTFSSNMFSNAWTSEQLVLDGDEYGTQGSSGPLKFDIIDTSNLIDHLGPLNLIPACAPLLNERLSSTMYTEALVQSDANDKKRMFELFGGETRSISLLLGLSPIEMWTNATNNAEDDSFMNSFARQSGELERSGQSRSRIRWKRTYSDSGSGSNPNIFVEPGQAALIFVEVYKHMFRGEDLTHLMSNLSVKEIQKRSIPYYNRASFAFLLSSLRSTMDTDWENCIDKTLSMVLKGSPGSPIAANFTQELLVHLHMRGVDVTDLRDMDLHHLPDTEIGAYFKSWSEVPAQVCISVRVPRKRLQVFTKRSLETIGSPGLRLTIESQSTRSDTWSNSFASVQVAFGEAELHEKHGGEPELLVKGSNSTWWGDSDLIMSSFVPTSMILLDDGNGNMPVVKCGILHTAQASMSFFKDLGHDLHFFATGLTEKDVFITRHMPGMSCLPICKPQLSTEHQKISSNPVILKMPPDGNSAASLTQRIRYSSENDRKVLADPSVAVAVHFRTPLKVDIRVGNRLHSSLVYPVPVDPARYKVRVARKSSYVEVEAPLWNPLSESSSSFIFPTLPPVPLTETVSAPVPWTATNVRLDNFPVIDIEDLKGLKWLITHASMAFSTNERRLREAAIAKELPLGSRFATRIEVKDGIFSMLMQYTGLQGQKMKIFGLSKDEMGVLVVLMPSCLRLDLVNRTVVLDVAALPITYPIMEDPKMQHFLYQLTSVGVVQIKSTADEIRCWKSMLPALAERCRTWKHKKSCEYVAKGETPIVSGLEDGKSPLCSCGQGKFPAGFLKIPELEGLDYVLKRYATRIALSPVFPVPYVEDSFMEGLSDKDLAKTGARGQEKCNKCGKTSLKVVTEGSEKLMRCSRCKKALYCSAECQKADWKLHKPNCVSLK